MLESVSTELSMVESEQSYEEEDPILPLSSLLGRDVHNVSSCRMQKTILFSLNLAKNTVFLCLCFPPRFMYEGTSYNQASPRAEPIYLYCSKTTNFQTKVKGPMERYSR